LDRLNFKMTPSATVLDAIARIGISAVVSFYRFSQGCLGACLRAMDSTAGQSSPA